MFKYQKFQNKRRHLHDKIQFKLAKHWPPLFIITYINVTILIIRFSHPDILINLSNLLNTLTNNHISKIFGNITYNMVLSLYWFYTYLLFICLMLFILACLLSLLKNMNVLRINDVLGWLFSLSIHQLNILLIAIMMSKKLFPEFNLFNIIIFFLFTFFYFFSYDIPEKKSSS